MGTLRVYGDFQNLDDFDRLRLTCAGTLHDLERQGIELHEGMVLTLYTDDEDDQGQPDELRVEGVVQYDAEGRCWVAAIDWGAIRHASDEDSHDARQSEGSGTVPVTPSTEPGKPVTQAR
jgi:hypothetical protein